MPIVSINHINNDVELGIWQIHETIDQLLALYPHLSSVTNQYRNQQIRLQKLCVYALLYEMIDDKKEIISHNEDGKPLLTNYNISISDTKGFVAIILSKNRKVAIDIEYYHKKVERITRKFIRHDESFLSLNAKLIVWCAKETLYKYYSNQHISFLDMYVHNFSEKTQGNLIIENIKGKQSLLIQYIVTPNFILTYTHS